MASIFTRPLFFLSIFLLFSTAPLLQAQASQDLVYDLNQHFRSSDRYIPAEVLQEQAVRALGPKRLARLAAMSQKTLLTILTDSAQSDPTLAINQGVVENLLKIQHIAKRSKKFLPLTEKNSDALIGLSQPLLDKLVEPFPKVDVNSVRQPGEFDFGDYEIERLAVREVLNNDLYNFKMAAGYFATGKHLSHRASFSLFSRGHKNRAYIVTAGQDMVADMLTQLRFTEREIQALKNNPEFANVPAEFFDYLRDFKFTGTVRAMKVGTVAFANEPILEITGNPVEAQIVETLVIPIINAMSHFVTKAARVVYAADGRAVVEGGTRRGVNGLMSGIAAYLGGAAGTSNATVGRLFNIPVYGSQSHAGVTIEYSELDAHINYHKFFPQTSLLGDTYEIINGMKIAIRAAGKDLRGVRIDSTIPGLDKAQTSQMVRKTLDDLGYTGVNITLSDGLDEYQLSKLSSDKAPFQFALVGTEIASPSDAGGLNVVYKLEQIQLSSGEVRDPMKFSTGKVSLPGEKQVVRVVGADGKYAGDTILEKSESVPAGALALLHPLIVDGVKVQTREALGVQRDRIKAELQKLPNQLLSAGITVPMADVAAYPVQVSQLLQQRQARAKATLLPKKPLAVGVYFGSFDPVTKAHVELVRSMKLLYNLDQVIVVPTGDDPILVENKSYMFTAAQRLAMLKRAFLDQSGVSVSSIQTKSRTRYAIDTLEHIDSNIAQPHEIYVLGGEDMLKTLPQWKNPQALLSKYHWVVNERGGSGKIELPAELTANFRVRDERHFVSKDGKVVEIVYLPKVVKISSTQVRKRFSEVEAIFHQVDTQKTFWLDNHGEGHGPLAVQGTDEILANVQTLASLAHASPKIKAIASKDSHHNVEVADATVNAEFHPSPDGSFPGFPRHGMANVSGPVGDARIPETENAFPASDKVVIPHQRPAGKKLKLVKFDLDAIASEVADPNVEIVIEKNGMDSYDVFKNPRTIEIYRRVNPNKSKPIFLYGVATDFCDRAAVLGLRKEGYEVYVITDAIRGVFPDTTAKALAEMQAAGAKFITTAEVVKRFSPGCEGLLRAVP